MCFVQRSPKEGQVEVGRRQGERHHASTDPVGIIVVRRGLARKLATCNGRNVGNFPATASLSLSVRKLSVSQPLQTTISQGSAS
jgi:hypothetical protein